MIIPLYLKLSIKINICEYNNYLVKKLLPLNKRYLNKKKNKKRKEK